VRIGVTFIFFPCWLVCAAGLIKKAEHIV